MTAPSFTTPDAPVALLETALRTLLGRCDGAHTLDGQGFSAWDSGWAREQDARLARGVGFANVESAHRILTKYRKQLAGAGIELPPMEVVHQAMAAAPPRVVGAIGGPRIERYSSMKVRVSFPYDPELVAKVKEIPGRMFDGGTKSWLVPTEQLPALIVALPTATLVGELAAELETQRGALEAKHQADTAAAIALRQRIAADLARYDAMKPTLGRTPFAHQDVGIRWLIEQRSAILADDMGLGKTFQALVAAKAIGNRIMVLAPAGLRVNWLREAEAVDVRIEVHSWAKVPLPLVGGRPYTLIADECHYAQNMKSQRTKNFLALAEAADCVFELTGTPIKNGRPSNLFPLLVGIQHPVSRDRKNFERRYCNAGPTRWSKWDVTGAAHLEELHGVIADRLLRRMKSEALDLPAKTRVWRDAELSPEARELYALTLNRMQAEYRRRVAEGEIDEANALVLLGHLAHAGSLGKVESAVELATDAIEEGGQVVLFTKFIDSADALVAGLAKSDVHAGRITGAEDSAQRQAYIDRFQAGELKAMVCTLGAGNVGITLTAAQMVILVDRPWTPGDAVQAEDRLHRIGQKNAVTAYWLQHGEFDEWLDNDVLQGKQERAEHVMGGERKALDVVRKPRTAKQFAKEMFANDYEKEE